MAMMTDKMLERTIGYLLCVYLNRKIKQAEAIIRKGGKPLMKLTGEIGKLHLSAKVQDTGENYNEQGARTTSTPYEVFNGEFTIEGVKNETNMELDELKHTVDSARQTITEFREKLGVPLMQLFDKYLDRGMKMGEQFFNKKLNEEPAAPTPAEDDKVSILEAKIASLKADLDELKKPETPAT